MEPRKDLTTLGLERMLLAEEDISYDYDHDGNSLYIYLENLDEFEQLKRQLLDDHNALEYAKQRMEESMKLMRKHTDNAQLYEFYKGQFLAYRQVVDPKYR